MANKQKTGLAYFPMEVTMFSDIKIRKLIKRKGGEAVSVYADLLCKIYKNGYYIRWDEELPFTVSEDTKFDEAFIIDVVTAAFEVGLLSKKMMEDHGVLTSKGIQDRYILICKQLKRSAILSEFILNSSEELPIDSEELPKIPNQLPFLPNQSDKGKQRKGKKNKENKIKVKENIELTLTEIENFIKEFTEPFYLECVEHLSNYKIEKGYTTKDDNLTIRRWVIDAVNQRKNRKTYDSTKKTIGDNTKAGGFGSL